MRLFAKFKNGKKTKHDGKSKIIPIFEYGNKYLAKKSHLSQFAKSKIGQKWEKNAQKWDKKMPKWADN